LVIRTTIWGWRSPLWVVQGKPWHFSRARTLASAEGITRALERMMLINIILEVVMML